MDADYPNTGGNFACRLANIADWFQQTLMVEPIDPLEGFVFDGLEQFPWAHPMDDLGPEQADDAFGGCIIVCITDATD